MLNVLKELVKIPGVSGNEKAVREYIKNIVTPISDKVWTDKAGNLIAMKKGTLGGKLMLAAHMDEIGFMVTAINENGTLKIHAVGGIDPRVAASKRVLVGADNIKGIISSKPIHLQEHGEREKVIAIDKMMVDIGAKDKNDAEKFVNTGDYVVFDSQPVEFGNNKLKAKAIDDRIGCAAIIEVLKKDAFPMDVYACFTVQEEIGLRGAAVVSNHIHPDMAIIIEGTTCADVPGVKGGMRSTIMGNGPAISFMDRSTIANADMFKTACDTADENNIPYQLKTSISGGNDAGRIQLSNGGVPTVVISIPTRYIHSPVNMIDINDYEAVVKLVINLTKRCKLL